MIMANQIWWLMLGCMLAFVSSITFTFLMRSYAQYYHVLDIPNERSSHHHPTPRGGGLAIVLIFLFAIMSLDMTGLISARLAMTLVTGGGVIALLGYYDDIYRVRARYRIVIHFIVALGTIYCLQGFPILNLGSFKLLLNWQGSLLAVIAIVWCINLYNFMDGIDGLAGSEGVFVALAMAILLVLEHQWVAAMPLCLLAATIAGFLYWNWPPAKIFMGDVGSSFLGYVFAVIAIDYVNEGFCALTEWLVLLALFLCDATFTVIYRVLQGKAWYSAHREHAYQQLLCIGATHYRVTLAIIALNCCLLFPVAYIGVHWPSMAIWGLSFIMALSALIWLVIQIYCRSSSCEGSYHPNVPTIKNGSINC